jgi:hypothetical protein
MSPLDLPNVPASWLFWVDRVNVGWAGVLLLASLFFQGVRMGFLVVVGSALCCLGHHYGIRTVEPLQDFHAAMILGTIFALMGYRLGRP